MSTCGALFRLKLPERYADRLSLLQKLGMHVALPPLFMTALTVDLCRDGPGRQVANAA